MPCLFNLKSPFSKCKARVNFQQKKTYLAKKKQKKWGFNWSSFSSHLQPFLCSEWKPVVNLGSKMSFSKSALLKMIKLKLSLLRWRIFTACKCSKAQNTPQRHCKQPTARFDSDSVALSQQTLATLSQLKSEIIAGVQRFKGYRIFLAFSLLAVDVSKQVLY